MDILLVAVNAKYIHSNLAVYSLKASAGMFEPQVGLAEYTINHQTDDIFRSVFRQHPKYLFFSCYIWNRSVILELAANLRKVLPQTVIWAGGPEVSYDAEEFLRENPQFDGVMCGEGEKTFFRLLEYYLKGCGSLTEIPGIAFRQKEGIQSTGAAAFLPLDEVPFVYGPLLAGEDSEAFKNRIIYYESSRGCPYSCSYCLSSIEKKVRFRSPESVKRELSFFLEKRVPQVKFVDRTFNCSHSHAQEIWKFIQEHDNGVTNFHFEIAADILTDEELELLAKMRPGLVQLEIGVQTVNEQTLSEIDRSASFEKIAGRVRRIAEAGNIHQHLDLIAGLPYEDFESFRHSFDTVYRLKPQELQLGFLKVLRGSKMHRKAPEYGLVYRSEPPYEVLGTRWISCEELVRLKEVEEMLEVYYNSRQFDHTINVLETLFETPFAMYDALAEYYRSRNPEGKSYSRMQRYEMLRGFIGKIPDKRKLYPGNTGQQKSGDMQHADWQEVFDELLTFDFYLRENAKSRPQWASDLQQYRERTAAFYRNEEGQCGKLPAYRGRTWKQMMHMTHLEHFAWDITEDGRIVRRERWVLFDYADRSPLTNSAAVYEVEVPEI